MKTVAIIQARMTSTRLPGKVLMDLAGLPMLTQQIKRLRLSRTIDEIVIATTVNQSDDPLVELAETNNVRWFRGSESDVLSRYVGAAKESSADFVVRITSDCPLIDAGVVDQVVEELWVGDRCFDYCANILERTYPRGLDNEAMTIETLNRLDAIARDSSDREHVTSYLRKPGCAEFTLNSVADSEDNSDLRWTVDTPTDLAVIRAIYHGLDLNLRLLPYREILQYVRAHPELTIQNAGVETWDPTKMK